MASQQYQHYGSQPSADEFVENTTFEKHSPEFSNEPQFVSFVSPESPDGNVTITNNITGELLGELQLGRSLLFERRKSSKPVVTGEITGNSESITGLEGGIESTVNCRKRLRSGTSEDHKKGKKNKINSENDTKDEGSSGFAHLNEFLSQIQHLNDGNLNFDLDDLFFKGSSVDGRILFHLIYTGPNNPYIWFDPESQSARYYPIIWATHTKCYYKDGTPKEHNGKLHNHQLLLTIDKKSRDDIDDVARRIKRLYIRNRLTEKCNLCTFAIKSRGYFTTCHSCKNYCKFKWVGDKNYLNNSIRYVAQITKQPDCVGYGLAQENVKDEFKT